MNRYHDRRGYRFTTENSIYIAPDHRGQAIGSLLLPPLIESARGLALHAIIAAIEDALSPFGVRFADMPLTPERIVTALRTAGAYEKLSAA